MINNHASKVMEDEYTIFMSTMHVSASKHLMDAHFTVLWANDGFYRLTGYEKEEYTDLFHNHIDEYYHDDPSTMETITSAIQKAFDGGEAGFELECRMPSKNSTALWVRIAGNFTAASSGSLPVIYAVCTDITSLKEIQLKLEEALHTAELASRAKSDFLSRMSHDIRTPMNAIIGMTEIASSHLENPVKLSDCLKKISLSSQHLLSLINDVLDISKIESGNMLPHIGPMFLPELIENIVTIMHPEIQEREQEFSIHLNGVRHEHFYSDALRLRQVFLNILSNACKFTPKGGIITMEITEQPLLASDMALLTFTFTDTGIGMRPEFVERIFDAFTREQGAAADKTAGTGLGMTISKRIIDMLNGTIQIDSQPGIGSVFTVQLPLKINALAEQTDAPPDASSDVPPDASSPDGRQFLMADGDYDFSGKTFLLVEDNQLNREIAQELLSSTGAVIETACDGQSGLDQFSRSPEGYYDLILMDIQMPVMDGYAATRAIRGLSRKDARTIPILATTADAFTEDIEAAKKAGMNGHLAKPLNTASMTRSIAEYLNHSADTIFCHR